MVDDLDNLLSSYAFAEAEQFITGLPDDEQEAAAKRLELARLACVPAARRRSNAIQAAARNHQFEALVEFIDDPLTKPLLAVLPIELQDAAEIQLAAAESWRGRKMENHARRLGEADEALDAYDLRLARSLISSVESRYLSETGRELRDRLLIDLEARTMESESLDATARQLEEELRPKRTKRWWQR